MRFFVSMLLKRVVKRAVKGGWWELVRDLLPWFPLGRGGLGLVKYLSFLDFFSGVGKVFRR